MCDQQCEGAVQEAGVAVDRILLHPGWDTRARLNDILAGHDLALLVLSREVDMYSTTTVPICLPGPADSFLATEGRAADVTGFGLIINPSTGARAHPDTVQTASVRVSSPEECRAVWPLTGSQICAAGEQQLVLANTSRKAVADSCNGDSGGGLTASNAAGREVVLGIVSFGEAECGRVGGKPGVYTSVAEHVAWVREMIRLTSGDQDEGDNEDDSDKDIKDDIDKDTKDDSDKDTKDDSDKDTKVVSDKDASESSSKGAGVGGLPGLARCVASNGKPCRFPFRFRGKVFASCTTDFDPENRAWCSTKGG